MKSFVIIWFFQLTSPSSAVRLLQRREVTTDPLEDCFEVPESLCIQSNEGRSFVVSQPSRPADMSLWYQFDKSLPVDESGFGRHLRDANGALTPVTVGPGILGRGGSAAFDGRTYRKVHAPDSLETASFSVTLWIYLLEDSIGTWRTIFNQGASADDMMPGLLLRPNERKLHLRASHKAAGVAESGTLESAGVLPMRRWTHITVACSMGGVLRLYINGVKDGEVIFDEPFQPPEGGAGDLFIGKDPWRAGVKAYLDDFRWYNRALSIAEIRAMVYPSLTGMPSNFVHLGCSSCKFTEASRSCGASSHLCSLQELFAGGFHTARTMGWLASSSEVWYHNEQGQDLFAETQKIGLCCAN